MDKKNIILIGGGGHCKACIDVIETDGHFRIAGIVDTPAKRGQKVLGYEVIASDEDLAGLVKEYQDFLITLGSIKDPSRRIRLFELLKKLGARLPVIISPLAHVARSASVGEGTIVMHRALINAEAQIGKNCIINSTALVEHESVVGDHCHISTGSIINGKCCVGDRVFIGSNSVLTHDTAIVDDVVIGAGAVVVKSVDRAGTYVGNPAIKAGLVL